MKKHFPLLLAIGIGLGVGFWLHQRQVSNLTEAIGETSLENHPGETYPQKLARYRAAADASVRAACTNYIVGLRTIIDLDATTYDANFKKWSATATVEFINPVGGVERTKLALRFDPTLFGEPQWFRK